MTVPGSGVGSQFGLAAESVYGTYVAPTRFLEATKASVKAAINTVDWAGLASGRLGNRADGRATTSKGGSVSIQDLVLTNQDMGLILELVMGGDGSPSADAGTPVATTFTFPLADTHGKMATMQSGVPQTDGTVVPYTALGCKVTSAEFSCGVDTDLTANIDCDARVVTKDETLAAASYAASRKPFHFGQMSVKVGDNVAGLAAVSGVRTASIKVERGIDTGQYYANNSGLKSEPTTNDKVKITGQLDVDFVLAADFADRYHDQSQFALEISFTGAAIHDSVAESITFLIPAAFLDADTPEVDGPDVVKTSFTFTAYVDTEGADQHMLTITYVSKDSAV